MHLRSEDISIGVTVYRRLDFLAEALTSAVNQSVPVQVHLHDDGCTDRAGLQRILDQFGDRVRYFRNAQTLGLFQNMNECIWNSPTPWVSVLHDDDVLERNFVANILEVAPQVEKCTLFCGGTTYIDKAGKPFYLKSPARGTVWKQIPPELQAVENQLAFPGQLMHVETAKRLGGFPGNSVYTGDWDLWFRLTAEGGAVQLGANVARYRSHFGADRGTTAASKSGRKVPGCAAQVKKNLAHLRRLGIQTRFDRRTWAQTYGPTYRDLLAYSWKMPRWLLRYNRKLLLLAVPQSRAAKLLHWVSKISGNTGLRVAGLARIALENMGYKMPQAF
ncbi:MAG: glycosyltransferase [Nibricoccus sp.]